MPPLGEAGNEVIKTNASRTSSNQCSFQKKKKQEPIKFIFCVKLPQSHPVSFSVFVCVQCFNAFVSVEPTSDVSLPVEVAAICYIVVMD